MMILIAGGAGYIGAHTNKLLNQHGYQTVVFDSLVAGHRDFAKWGEFVQADLADREQIAACFGKYPISAVMHFSAFACVGESVAKPAAYYQNNVVNTLNLLDAMREFGVKYFIFSSTCATYGNPQTIPMSESHRQSPINPYGWSKLMVERILADYDHAYGLKHINLRYFNAAGADPDAEVGERHDPETHLIPLAVYAALGKIKQLGVYGTDYPTADGTCVRDYVHVNDLADAHIKALEYLKAGNDSDAFNLGTDQGTSVREVIETVKRVSRHDLAVVEQDRRPGDPPTLVSSSEKARTVLKWAPKLTDIETIVTTAWNWHRQDTR